MDYHSTAFNGGKAKLPVLRQWRKAVATLLTPVTRRYLPYSRRHCQLMKFVDNDAGYVNECPSINGIFRPMPAFSLFAILGVDGLRLCLRDRCGLGLNRNLPFLDGH
jgi:hypothetical protein